MSLIEMGCCGAYCRTCRVFGNACQGCKAGYEHGKRDIGKAKCMMKRCCMGKGLDSCADCARFASCGIINAFHSKTGHKYGKYREAILFIRRKGYEAFFKIADSWTNAYGRYK